MMKIFNKTTLAIASAVAFGLAVPSAAMAEDMVSLSSLVQLEKIVVQDGEEKRQLVAPTSVIPGDRLLFTNTYRNVGNELVEDFVITNPLPAAILLSEVPSETMVSIDGGETFGTLENLRIQANSGVSRDAQAADVTHIRWTVARVEPGAAGTVEFYGQVR